MSTKQTFAKFVSVVTVVPAMALFMQVYLYLTCPEWFGGRISQMLPGLICLVAIPLLAYPTAHIAPAVHARGREGERELAFLFALAGYALGEAAALFMPLTEGARFILTGYFISGVLLAFVNGVLKIKASGHACGVAAPIVILLYARGIWALWTILLLPLVYWARIALGRHTMKELLLGTANGLVAVLLAALIFL